MAGGRSPWTKRERIWSVMKDARGPSSAASIARATGYPHATVTHCLRDMQRRGWVTFYGGDQRSGFRWVLTTARRGIAR